MLVPEPSDEYNAVYIARSLLPTDEDVTSLYALQVIGDGMIDALINDGDIIVIKPATEAHNGEMVVIRVEDEYIFKYFFKEKDRFRLQSANPAMKPIIVSKDTPIEIKGKVIMVIRQSKIEDVKFINND
jgi:repressor LexA